jgi:DNA polymerase-3 subunit alpha
VADFIHLHVHTAFSLSEGAIKLPKLLDLCKRLDMPAVAATDTNNLFGALQFAEMAAAEGIQPIIGLQQAVDVPHFQQAARGRSVPPRWCFWRRPPRAMRA